MDDFDAFLCETFAVLSLAAVCWSDSSDLESEFSRSKRLSWITNSKISMTFKLHQELDRLAV